MIRVTLCRDARLVRPLGPRLQRQGFNGDGRTSRASLQIVTRHGVRWLLVVSRWLLDVSCWPLAVGCWLVLLCPL